MISHFEIDTDGNALEHEAEYWVRVEGLHANGDFIADETDSINNYLNVEGEVGYNKTLIGAQMQLLQTCRVVYAFWDDNDRHFYYRDWTEKRNLIDDLNDLKYLGKLEGTNYGK